VFVDPAGRRLRRLQLAAALGALAGATVLVALILGSLGLGPLPGLSTVFGGKADTPAPTISARPTPPPAHGELVRPAVAPTPTAAATTRRPRTHRSALGATTPRRERTSRAPHRVAAVAPPASSAPTTPSLAPASSAAPAAANSSRPAHAGGPAARTEPPPGAAHRRTDPPRGRPDAAPTQRGRPQSQPVTTTTPEEPAKTPPGQATKPPK
jgi:hypothetical protein